MDPLQALKEKGSVNEDFITQAELIISETGKSYESVFEELGMNKGDVRTFMAEYYKVPSFIIPEGFSVGQKLLAYISHDSSVHYHMVPLVMDDDVFVVGVNNPDSMEMREALNFISTKHNFAYRLV